MNIHDEIRMAVIQKLESDGISVKFLSDRSGIDRGQLSKFLASKSGIGPDKLTSLMAVLNMGLKIVDKYDSSAAVLNQQLSDLKADFAGKISRIQDDIAISFSENSTDRYTKKMSRDDIKRMLFTRP